MIELGTPLLHLWFCCIEILGLNPYGFEVVGALHFPFYLGSVACYQREDFLSQDSQRILLRSICPFTLFICRIIMESLYATRVAEFFCLLYTLLNWIKASVYM